MTEPLTQDQQAHPTGLRPSATKCLFAADGRRFHYSRWQTSLRWGTGRKPPRKRRESQARGKLLTQNRSHGSLGRASQRLSRLPLRLRQEPQLLVTNFLFHQKHQVAVQLPVQRHPIVVLISICQIKKSLSTKLQSITCDKQQPNTSLYL